RLHQMRGDAGERPALADEQTHLPEVHRLERAQAPVQCLEVVERGGRADVRSVDERDGQASKRGVPGGNRPVNSGADYHQIEADPLEAGEVASHITGANGGVTADSGACGAGEPAGVPAGRSAGPALLAQAGEPAVRLYDRGDDRR